MNYIIGSGAILEAGPNASITPACLHAHVDASLAHTVKAAAVDFESTRVRGYLSTIGFDCGRKRRSFRELVSDRLRAMRTCSLADVLGMLARAAGCTQVHLFAHWLPDQATCARMREEGIETRGPSAREHRGGLRGCRAALPALASGLAADTAPSQGLNRLSTVHAGYATRPRRGCR